MSSSKRCAVDKHKVSKKIRTDTNMACSSSSTPVDKWQDDSLAETNLHMLENEIMCDVTFLAGEKREPVSAHKFMLVSRSPVFYAMFCGPLAESKSEIPVPDIEADVLNKLIRFLYTEQCDLTSECVMTVLYAAKKYDVALEQQCWEFLEWHTNDQNVCIILQKAIDYDNGTLIEHCLSHVFDNAENILDSRGFLSLGREALQMILDSDDLFADELTIYQACLNWARYQLSEAGKPTTDHNVRESLGELLFLIRIPLMSQEDFTLHVSQTYILTDTEKIAIFQNYTMKRDTGGPFSGRERWAIVDGVINRFTNIECDWLQNNIEFAITFICSKNAILCGVILFTPSKPGSVEGTLELYDDNDRIVSKNIKLEYSETTNREEVTLDPPLHLKQGENYQISQICNGQVTYSGRDGDSAIVEKGLRVLFTNSTLNVDGRNNLLNGPICGLRFK